MMKIAVSDIEANNWIKFLMIGFYDGKKYKIFSSLDKYLDYILTFKYNHYKIYFHNGGRYDFLFLIEKLLDRGYLEFIERSGGLIMLKFRAGSINIEFRDSFTLFPASLEKLISVYKIPYKKIKVNFNKVHSFNDKILQAHLKNDCLSLYNILDIALKENGKLNLTVASQALYEFEHNYLDGYIWNLSDRLDKYFRTNFYRGGRVEVYKGFGKNLFYYDFNSLYPSVMLEKMPVGSSKTTKTYIKDKPGYYKIKLLNDTNFLISPLIYKNKTGNYYVNGNKGDILYVFNTDIEILHLEKIKYKILKGHYFQRSEYLFNDYINHFYELKKNAPNEYVRYYAKLLLNALYGKFGQKLKGQKIVVGTKGKIFDAENDLFIVDTKLNVKYKGVYLASYITALARNKLYMKMKEIGFNNIWYCDTDSIITNKKIKTSDEIGELKLEDEIKEGVFLLGKTYAYISKRKDKKGKNIEVSHYKGFPKDSFTYIQLKNLLLGKVKDLSIHDNRILGFRESIKRKNNIKINEGKYLKLCEYDKVLKSNYVRRKISKSKENIFNSKCFTIKEL